MGFGEKFLEVSVRAKKRIDLGEICNVVAVIDLRRQENWTEPSGSRSNLLQVWELLNDSSNIADAIVVGVFERARVDLVELS